MSLNTSDVITFVAGSTSPVSSKEVAFHFGKTHPGISHLMAELVGAGVLKMVGTRKVIPARRGRPEFLFEAVPGVENPLSKLAEYRASVSAAKKAWTGLMPERKSESRWRTSVRDLRSSSSVALEPRAAHAVSRPSRSWSTRMSPRGV